MNDKQKMEQAIKICFIRHSHSVLLAMMFDTIKQIIGRLFDNDDEAKNIERYIVVHAINCKIDTNPSASSSFN